MKSQEIMDRKPSVEKQPPLQTEDDDDGPGSPNSAHDDNDNDNTTPPRKRQKRSPPTHGTSTAGLTMSKKGRACIACRKLKVKCDSAERGLAGCSRCQRLGLECVNARRLTMNLDEAEVTHPSIVRLDRAVEEILQKLKMPPLEMYTKPLVNDPTATGRTTSEFQATRENSREPADGNDIAPAPMGSLFEVTQLNSLRSRLRKVKPKQRTSRRSMEHDLIALNLVSLEDAEEMFDLFKKSLARYLFAATMPEETTLMTVRESSTLLFTAVMLVSALHIPGKESIHNICHKQFLELIATTMFERFHTLDDIRGLCIAAFWQPDLSWKLSGLCIRMATELNLHQAFYSAFYTQNITEEQRKIALEKARIWYLLYVLDHHFSIAYGRPPVTAELLPIKELDVFVNSPWCTASDRRMISQVAIFVTLSKAFEVFGLEAERLMGSDDVSLLMHLRFTEDIRAWHDRWRTLVQPDKYVAEYPSKGVPLHYHFSSLVLNSLALRGRPLESLSSLPPSLRPIALNAIEAAHSILQFFLDEPSYRNSLVGIPLYLHSMIAFAVVFLMKTSHRWHAIGITTDPETRTRPLIEGIISTLRQCKAGANHMVYSMAAGFERMLKNWGRPDHATTSKTSPRLTRKRGTTDKDRRRTSEHPATNNTNAIARATSNDHLATTHSPESFTHHNPPPFHAGTGTGTGNAHPGPGPGPFSTPSNPDVNYYDYQNQLVPGSIPYNDAYGMGLENDMLWSAGLGYDLLHTNRQDLTLGDFGLGLNFFDGAAAAGAGAGAAARGSTGGAGGA